MFSPAVADNDGNVFNVYIPLVSSSACSSVVAQSAFVDGITFMYTCCCRICCIRNLEIEITTYPTVYTSYFDRNENRLGLQHLLWIVSEISTIVWIKIDV